MAAEDCLSKIIRRTGGITLMAEIGVLRAQNAIALAKEFSDLSIIAIDSYEAYSDELHRYWVSKQASLLNKHYAIQAIKSSGCSDRITLLTIDSNKALEQIENETLDLVFIDKNLNHDEHVNDVEQWYRKVRSGGILAGHDAYTPAVINATKVGLNKVGQVNNPEIVDGEVWFVIKD
jgi:predicted O-methyltransferase YrrM